jgi:hypothetical protein
MRGMSPSSQGVIHEPFPAGDSSRRAVRNVRARAGRGGCSIEIRLKQADRAPGLRRRRVALVLLLAVATLSCARSQEEGRWGRGGEPGKLNRLDRTTLAALRDSFNAAIDRPRILVMLSPT